MSQDLPKKLSAFGVAAVAFDQELQRFQQLTEAAKRVELDSRKNIERAAKAATEAAESHARMSQHMNGLVAALQEAHEQNERCVNELNARRTEISNRMDEVSSLVTRVNALGSVAKEISGSVVRLGELAKAGAGAGGTGLLDDLGALIGRMDELLEEARGLAHSAQDAQIAELAAEVESLRQQISNARNKMDLFRQKLGEIGRGSRPSG